MNRIPMVGRLVSAAGVAVLFGLALGYWLGQRGSAEKHAPAPAAATVKATAKAPRVLYWYDPMAPEQHFDKPGKSPFMDMQLVPKLAQDMPSDGLRIAPGVQQNLGIRVAVVRVAPGPGGEVVAPGTLQWDLRGEQRVSSRVEGYVDEVFVRAPFERVRAGQALAAITAPKLATALAEYRALGATRSDEAGAVRNAARARLRVLGLGDADLRGSAGGLPRVTLRAPAAGVLSEILVRAGDTVMPGQSLFRLNATDRLWLEARLPQASAAGITPGAQVRVRASTYPGEEFSGTVETLLPELDPQTRTQTARIVLDNADGRLAAGMFAEAVFTLAATQARPWIDSESLILTGRDARVIVQHGDGSFRPVRVTTGRQADGRTEVLAGLSGGERVVVSGQFLLDSEAGLRGALERLEGAADAPPKPSEPTPAVDHSGHDMSGHETPQGQP